MKKTVLFTSVALSAFLLSQSTSVIAAVTPVQYSSNASVTFTPNTDPTKPVDPTDPNKPFVPNQPSNPGTAGPLSIDFASSLDFGTQKITSTNETYYAALTSGIDASGAPKDVPNYVQVTDNTGEDLGWSLNVTQMDDFLNGANILNGAQISFTNGNALTATGSNAGVPTAATSFILKKGAATVVTTAQANEGQGTWVTRYGNDATSGATAIALDVPGAATKRVGAYTTTLQWNLSQTPSVNNAI
ncbi:MAG: WxL domain-containing protein [Lactobacillaceae bacterium]|jgi:hypothetical protein|nr:WxL domain-containing protein [Lactobacillaceae bacterium]